MNKRNYKHGASNTSMYYRWQNIKDRCYNKKCWAYQWYGANGIKMHEPWRASFVEFYEYIKSIDDYPGNSDVGYKKTIDRIDNNGNYEPGNLRFIDMHSQCTNRKKRIDNSSGFTGVYKNKNKYQAHIRINGRGIHLGTYNDAYEAKEARNKYITDNNLNEYNTQ